MQPDIVEIDHVDAVIPQQLLVAAEIDALADHDRRDLEQDDGAGAGLVPGNSVV